MLLSTCPLHAGQMYAYAFVTTHPSLTRKRFPHVRRWFTWPVRMLLITDWWQAGQTYWKLSSLCVAFPVFGGKVASLLALVPACSFAACKALCLSSAFPVSCLHCFSFGSPARVSALSHSFLRFCSVLASWPSSLRCFAFGSAPCVWEQSSSLSRFLSAIAARTSVMTRAFFSSTAVAAAFACVAAIRWTALLMLPRGMGHFPAVATDLVTITRTMLRQPSFKSGRCLLYVAYTASPPAPSFPRTIQTHSTAIACPFPRRGRKFLFGFASVANTAQLCLLARLTNTIKCGLWTCMFCHECIFLFPGRACHALPRLLRLHVPMNALFADSSRICAFPSTSRERRGRLWFVTFCALSLVSVLCSQRAPIQVFTAPEPQQQFPPDFSAFLKRCGRKRPIDKQTMPVSEGLCALRPPPLKGGRRHQGVSPFY